MQYKSFILLELKGKDFFLASLDFTCPANIVTGPNTKTWYIFIFNTAF